ncbi:hypothetical protein GCM10011521_20170 [Arenimonas soli]|uniref:histidine kinase n=1 Tax=Arenimonas soli TaxID=2269504 RepID=A0ABQ1HKU0_9GAMM|nr:ATP-binding protein [Arenimonas soli]GGA81790.1 hypothetical protein GCM10011521_20170 [Arenimonas soli]
MTPAVKVAPASGEMSLVDLTRRLGNGTMEQVVAALGERRLAPLRVLVLGLALVWVMGWRTAGTQPVLVADAHRVYPWAVAVFVISALWWLALRSGRIRTSTRVDAVGTVANYLIIAVLTKHAFLLLITLEAVLPFLAILVGARYSQRWFKLAVAASFAVLLWSAPPGYWLSRPAYLVYAIVLTVGLPLLIGRILSALREVSLQALEAMDAQNRFVGAMSHELRTPLNVIINAIALIDREGLSTEQRDLLAQSATSARAMANRVDNVLDVALQTAGRIELRKQSLDPRDLMRTVRDINAPEAAERGVALSVCLAHDIPGALLGDQGRIEQVLSNLTGNAIRYTPSGGRVDVTLQALPADLPGEVELVCTVADTGIGIPDAEKARIFEAFYQVSSGAARVHGGVGLGLFIVRSVTERLGGSMTVGDNPGGGTIFTWRVRLPVAKDIAPVEGPESLQALLREHRSRVAPVRCLVVDDHAPNVDIMRRLLGGAGHAVHAVDNGRDGLAAIRGGDFDLAFLDLHMPQMSGGEVLDALREDPPVRPVPVIVLSAQCDQDAVSTTIARGAAAFVSKPVSARRLLAVVHRYAAAGAVTDDTQDSPMPSPLDELRQFGDSRAVGKLLREVRAGLAQRMHALERASDCPVRAGDALHGLRNEFATIGNYSGISLVARTEHGLRAGVEIDGDMKAIQREVQSARAWIATQPEFQLTNRS